MTREEKCKLAIDKGFTYNAETGQVFGVRGKEITRRDKDNYIDIGLFNNGKSYNLRGHQFAWYWVNKEIVEHIDHINGEPSDNKISNLRPVTNQQNHFNQTKAKGYYWNQKLNKWIAQIMLNGKKIHLGCFDNEEDARAAYLEAKEKYHIITKPSE
jgi:hypothetical protein